ncbi:MAG: 4-oxalocrotonate tautomerase family protein [Desulfuromonadales bacterium]|nr:4-oxalocrotonate tautomerase family protein [Desulfuromonadales bacterium]NIR34438.1 4-oxalocrotonate tautomerase family protein [Desulfuromonadales bacterium]NIS42975.1 4-oxalocrotonate tautomerase family protein [Desulfuromonadales bacterium]
MPVIILKTVDGATSEQKARLVECFTSAVRDVLGKNPEITHVIFEEYPEENWGLRGKTVADIRSGR